MPYYVAVKKFLANPNSLHVLSTHATTSRDGLGNVRIEAINSAKMQWTQISRWGDPDWSK